MGSYVTPAGTKVNCSADVAKRAGWSEPPKPKATSKQSKK